MPARWRSSVAWALAGSLPLMACSGDDAASKREARVATSSTDPEGPGESELCEALPLDAVRGAIGDTFEVVAPPPPPDPAPSFQPSEKECYYRDALDRLVSVSVGQAGLFGGIAESGTNAVSSTQLEGPPEGLHSSYFEIELTAIERHAVATGHHMDVHVHGPLDEAALGALLELTLGTLDKPPTPGS